MAGFNQKPSFRKGKPTDSGANDRPSFRPEKNGNGGIEKPRFDNSKEQQRPSFRSQDRPERRSSDRSGSFDRPRNFDSDRPKGRNFEDRGPRRDFNDRPESREHRSSDRSGSFDRPRNFDSDRPKDRNFEDRGSRRDFNDRPESRERRSSDRGSSFDRPRNFDSDRPKGRNFEEHRSRQTFDERSGNRSFRPSAEKSEAKRGGDRKRSNELEERGLPDFDRNQQFINDDDFFEKKPEFGTFVKPIEDNTSSEKPVFEDHFQFSKTSKPEFTDHLKETEPSETEKEDMRLNKYVALSGIASRRTAAEYIKNKELTVNEVVVIEPGYRVQPGDIIRYKGSVISPVKDLVYLLLNKPKNVITTVSDAQGRKTVLDIVENATESRIYPVGRLDRDTTGLLILTNDGDLARKLSHPSNDVKKIYQVTLDRPVSVRDLEKIQAGLELEDGVAEVDAVGHIEGGRRNEIGIEIHIGKNRIVRRIFEHLGYEVEKLDRVYYAGLTKKDLPRGHYRPLTEKELIMLKHFI